jgi:Ca-activated chloride channel family protein
VIRTPTLAFALTLIWGVALAQITPYRFGVRIDSVIVDVYVGQRGQPLTGLTTEDFEVFDNGVRQDIQLLDTDVVSLSAVLVSDISRSVRGEKLNHLREAARSFLEGLAERDRFSLVTFNHYIQRRSPWNRDREWLIRVLGPVEGDGGTALYDAIYAGIKVAEPIRERPMLLIFTDGEDLHSRLSEDDVIQLVKESSAVIHVVGTAPSVDATPNYLSDGHSAAKRFAEQTAFLRRITDDSGGRFLKAKSSADLKRSFLRILSEMKDRYLLSYTPKDVPQNGWHTLQVRLRHQSADIRARRGYYAFTVRDES